jgi:cell wall-associated NlpC family hydrolase
MSEQVIPGRNEIVAAAREYIGVKFVHMGRGKEGIDCIGLIVRVIFDLGIENLIVEDVKGQFDDRFNTYSRRPQGNYLRQMIGQVFVQVPIEKALKGDVLFLTGDNWVHIGIKSKSDAMIHAYALAPGKVCEHRLTPVWMNRVKCAFSFPFFHAKPPCKDMHLVGEF